MKRPFRKPLILMTPKSLLRSEQCVSGIADFTGGQFHEILPGPLTGPPEAVRRVIFCSGKVYYDLLSRREAEGRTDTALVRIEQIYPLHREAVREAIELFKNVNRWVWCQEEPRNMGAWSHLAPRLREIVGAEVAYAGRAESASTAVGALAVHRMEQRELVDEAFR